MSVSDPIVSQDCYQQPIEGIQLADQVEDLYFQPHYEKLIAQKKKQNGKNGSLTTEWKSIRFKVDLQATCQRTVEQSQLNMNIFSEDIEENPIQVVSGDIEKYFKEDKKEKVTLDLGEFLSQIDSSKAFTKPARNENVLDYFQYKLDQQQNIFQIVLQLQKLDYVIDQHRIIDTVLYLLQKQTSQNDPQIYSYIQKLFLVCPITSLIGSSKVIKELVKQQQFNTIQIIFQNIEHIWPKDVSLVLGQILNLPVLQQRPLGIQIQHNLKSKQKKNGRDKDQQHIYNHLKLEIDEIYKEWLQVAKYKVQLIERNLCKDKNQQSTFNNNQENIQECQLLLNCVSKFPKYQVQLHCIIALRLDHASIVDIICRLDSRLSLSLLRYLRKWFVIYSTQAQSTQFFVQDIYRSQSMTNDVCGDIGCNQIGLGYTQNIPSFEQVIQWMQGLIDARFGDLDSPAFQEVLQDIATTSEDIQKNNEACIGLQGALQHLLDKKKLPQIWKQQSQYSVQVIDLG